MTVRLAIALAQINPVMGDIVGNVARIRSARQDAAAQGADLVVFPELCLPGYPPEDLILKPFFLDRIEEVTAALAAETADGGPGLVIGVPWRDGGRLYNAAAVLDQGAVVAVRFKHDLPNYGVFDEKRVFAPGALPEPVSVRGVRLGVMVCEDMWTPVVVESLRASGAEILIVPNGSPFDDGKPDTRLSLATARVTESGLPLVYVNQVGGQDELVFDGQSFVVGRQGTVTTRLASFEPCVQTTHWERRSDGWDCTAAALSPAPEGLEAIYRAMVLGLRDYVGKNGFPGVIIGLSGGIDSALTAVVAVDALGADQVRCVMMPSPYTSQASLDDAAEMAETLGIFYDSISIAPAMATFDAMLAPYFAGREPDIAEENIQSRARGITLMALSNKFGHMVLSTGNKSEMSVGYATLYGDMAGGFSVLKDVYKTTVFALSEWRNQNWAPAFRGPQAQVIPDSVLTKPPSAELKPDQTDQETLPPYVVLDDILECLIEREMGLAEIIARGHDQMVVNRVWRMLDRAEYKRRQAPPGVKLTTRAFGRDRRYPITNAFVNLLAADQGAG